ncbi:hypothetical protein PN499_00295 [Kamptonema animale CS-326]|jgi:hypothetical protein|uniref:hypothetical protein n=1 Tax=Kamptonema animale TaxID=92934 RepID=UPI0023307483|nr:hypothetical protein [Kamptonema animale]MDB9509645.1 hypothetical protein [Kamptonema animale CS-326]
MAKEKERVDFLWRYQPFKSTPDGVLMSYIKGNLLLPSREMILQALRPYWLPLAYLEKGDIDPVILGRLFKNAVYVLEKQALYLRERGGIEYPPIHIGGMPISSIPSSRELPADIEESDRSRLNGASLRCSHHDPSKLTANDLFELDDFDDSGFA